MPAGRASAAGRCCRALIARLLRCDRCGDREGRRGESRSCRAPGCIRVPVTAEAGQEEQRTTARFTLHAPGPCGAQQAGRFGCAQVMEIDGRVELSGQGGWHPGRLDYPAGVSTGTEVGRAFDNVACMLDAVGLA